MRNQVFDGIKVADFSWVVTGPTITRYLADQGATVIRIESAITPDLLRTTLPFKDGVSGLNRGAGFANFNCNKYSVSLNLRHSKGVEVAKKLVAWCDIVCESFTPGTMQQWGLGYEELKKIKRNLIMLSTSNQGQTGPSARHPGLGMQLVSLAGFTELTGWPDRCPAQPFGAYTDLVAPHFGAAALIAALDYRRRTGEGQYIDLSQFEASLHFLTPVILDYVVNGREASRAGNRCRYAVPHAAYPCRGEDRWCVIAVFSDQEWHNLCQAMGNPAWSQDSKFATFLERKENEEELDNLISTWTIEYHAEEVMTLLQGVGVAAGVVKNPRDIQDDPQLKHRNHFWLLEHPEIGKHHCDATPFYLFESPAQPLRAAPLLGEHNEYVLKELLGLSDEVYTTLLLEGVLE